MADNRYSILTDDLDCCIVCGRPHAEKHEIFFGSGKRKLSIKYGLVIPLCYIHHRDSKSGIHFNKALREYWFKKGQEAFEKCYPKLDFMEIFGRNYI